MAAEAPWSIPHLVASNERKKTVLPSLSSRELALTTRQVAENVISAALGDGSYGPAGLGATTGACHVFAMPPERTSRHTSPFDSHRSKFSTQSAPPSPKRKKTFPGWARERADGESQQSCYSSLMSNVLEPGCTSNSNVLSLYFFGIASEPDRSI